MSRPSSSAMPSQKYQDDMYDDQEPQPGVARHTSRNDYPGAPTGVYFCTSQGYWHNTREVENNDPYYEQSARSEQDRYRGDVSRRYPASGRPRSPNYHGVSPNRTVILEGTMELTQEDLLNNLQSRLGVNGIEQIRLIRDKRTGQPRGFAFVQFYRTADAISFMENHHPSVAMFPGHGSAHQAEDQIPVRIAYSKDREEKDWNSRSEDDWKCDVCRVSNFSHRHLCFRCNAPRTRATANGIMVTQASNPGHSGMTATGDSDASSDGGVSQFIMIRSLEPGANEELLAKGVRKLYKSNSDTLKQDSRPAKKAKITSTFTETVLGAKEGSLRRVLLVRDRRTGESWRYGFAEFGSVEDAQSAMAKFNSLDRFTISSRPVIASYIHAGVFVPVLPPIDDNLVGYTFAPLNSPAVRLMYWDENAYVSEFLVERDAKSPGPDGPAVLESTSSATPKSSDGLVESQKDVQPKQKRRKIEKDAKMVAPHLQFWTDQHAELHDESDIEASRDSEVTSKNVGSASAEAQNTQSFADIQRKCCLLCSRQFKSEEEVHKHERASRLHLDNLKNAGLVAKALTRMKKSAAQSLEIGTYRDRAQERRQVYNQPKQPAQNRTSKSEAAEGDDSSLKEVQSKGAALLGKMGWSEGEGLGAHGLGSKEAIQTQLYTQGVGLGAEGGKVGDAVAEANRQTKSSYSDFLTKGKEQAKARFESLNQ